MNSVFHMFSQSNRDHTSEKVIVMLIFPAGKEDALLQMHAALKQVSDFLTVRFCHHGRFHIQRTQNYVSVL